LRLKFLPASHTAARIVPSGLAAPALFASQASDREAALELEHIENIVPRLIFCSYPVSFSHEQ